MTLVPHQIRPFWSNGWSVIMEIGQKMLTPQALPFKVTEGHWNRHGSIN